MLNKTFYAVTDQNVVFPIIVTKEVVKDDDVTAIKTQLVDPDNTPQSAHWHHEEYLELIYVSSSNNLSNRSVFETETEANNYAIKNIDEKIDSTERLLQNLIKQKNNLKNKGK